MRLQQLRARYDDRIRLRWRAFPLIPDQRPGRVADAHTRLFTAHFHEHADISQPAELLRLAGEVGLDVDRLARDCAGDTLQRVVLEDWAEAVAWFGVSALLTVIFNEKVALVGVRTVEEYAHMVEWLSSSL